MSAVVPSYRTSNTKQGSNIAIFGLAFRPFFLLGSIFSILCLTIWAAQLSGRIDASIYGGGLWWHIHEMLFGFVCAIIVGFLLTAVQTWTGRPSIKGAPLAILVGVWLLARIFFFLPQYLPSWLINATDLAFLPLAAFFLARPIIAVKMWRNIIFVPLLLVMTYLNGSMHCAVYISSSEHLLSAASTTVLIVTLLMCIMGGRVIPMFTANGTQTTKVAPAKWLEIVSIASVLALVLIALFNVTVPDELMGILCIFAALMHALRVARWRIWVTLRTPLVWSLHLSYWCIPLGLLFIGLSRLGIPVSQSQGIHTLTVGAIGLMILAMISRVSLGHTGREIVVGKLVAIAFGCLFFAFVIRVFGSYIFTSYITSILVAAILWIAGYGIFVLEYFPILSKPRIDGKPG